MNPEALRARIEGQLGESDGRLSKSLARPSIPDHELLARIGGGSYGDVWLARGITANLYAVKVVWRGNFSSDRPYEREFSGIARFEPISRSHPAVVNVLHIGRDEACFFYIMELADAATKPEIRRGTLPTAENDYKTPTTPEQIASYHPRTLASELKGRGRLPVGDVLRLGVRLADALEHLHQHGLVHRDVKPSNVIFVKGQVKLADIGLVTGLDEAHSFVGTEGFIPPEGPGTAKGDVFALGRLLYSAATGKDRCDFPELPADLDQWNDREAMLELNEVLARACAPDPVQRHASAAALMADLNLLLSGRSIRRAYGIEQRLRRVGLIAAFAALIALATATSVWFQHRQRQQADARASRETLLRERAQQSEQLGRERLRQSLLQEALALTASSQPERRARALAALHTAGAIRPDTDLRDAAVAAMATPELRVLRHWQVGLPTTVVARPDVNLKRYFRADQDGSVTILSTADDQEIMRLPAVGKPSEFGQFSADGHWLALKDVEGAVQLWDLINRTNRLMAKHVTGACLTFTAGDAALLVAQENGEVRLMDVASGAIRWASDNSAEPNWVAAHPIDPVVAVAFPSRIRFYNCESGEMTREVPATEGLVGGWTHDGNHFLTTQDDFSIRSWDWPQWEGPNVILRFHRSEPSYLASDPSGRWIASAGWDNQVFWSDAVDGRLLLGLAGDGVAAASDRPAFLLFRRKEWTLAELDAALVPETIPMHRGPKSPYRLCFSPDGKWIATAGPDGLWLLNSATRHQQVVSDEQEIKAIGFGPDSHSLYAMLSRKILRFDWQLSDAETQPSWALTQAKAVPAKLSLVLGAITPDGQAWIGLGQQPKKPFFWYMGRLESEGYVVYRAVPDGPEYPALSPDGQWLAWGNWRDNNAHVVNPQSTNEPITLKSEGSTTVAFSPNGHWLVVSDSAKTRFYEVGSFQPRTSIPRTPAGSLPALLAFSPDSRMLATTLPPNHVQLIDVETGTKLTTLETPERHFLGHLAFSPDGQVLAVASQDHALLLWDLAKLRGNLRALALDW